MADWGNVGKHRFCVDGDTFVTFNDGPVSLAEMRTLMSKIEQAVQNDGVRYYMMNLARAEAPSPEARRWMAQNPYQGITAVVGYGASRTLRIVSDLMRRAMELLDRDKNRTPFRLFETEAEARAFLHILRTPQS